MKLIAVTAAVWIVIAAVWWLTVGAEVAKAQPRQATPDGFWEQVAGFYAGRPVTFNWDPKRTGGASTAQMGSINFPAANRGELDRLAAVLRNPKAKHDEFWDAGIKGIDALAVLIHEAIHNRDFGGGVFSPGRNPSGFYGAGNERQAGALGAELVPDLLKRFFGIGLDDKRSRQLAKWAKSRGEYTSAYLFGGAPGEYEGNH